MDPIETQELTPQLRGDGMTRAPASRRMAPTGSMLRTVLRYIQSEEFARTLAEVSETLARLAG